MHDALNCNLNIWLPLMSNLKVMEFSQTSFAFHKAFLFSLGKKKMKRETKNSLGDKLL